MIHLAILAVVLIFAASPAEAGFIAPAIAAALGGGAIATAIATFAVRLVTALALSFLANALAPKQRPTKPRERGRLVNARSPAAAQEYVYGTVRKGGTIFFLESTGVNNERLHMLIALAGHEVNAIGDIYINDELVTLDGNGFVSSGPFAGNFIRVRKHLGADDQEADSALVAESNIADATFRGRGIAYLYVRFQHDSEVFASGLPLITAMVEGFKVYDPRDTSTGHSANAALCIRHYITSAYGLNDAAVDDPLMQVAANVADEDVDLAAGGTQKRYEINGVLSAEDPVGSNLTEMLTGCAGELWWGQGAWRLKPAYYTAPVKTLTLDDLRGPIAMQPRVNTRDNFNAVQGTFLNAADDYVEADYPIITSAAFRAEDGGEQQAIDFELPFEIDAARAQRLAKLALFRGREQITFSADFGLEAFELQVGDTVALTIPRYGWVAKKFEVKTWRFFVDRSDKALKVNMTLRETSEAAFEWDAEEQEIISNNTNLPAYNSVPPVGLAASSETLLLNEKITNVWHVDVTANYPSFVDFVEVEYRKDGAANYTKVGTGELGRFDVVDVEPGIYDFRARAINMFGVRGAWEVLASVTLNEANSSPADVTGFNAEVSGGVLKLSWDASPDIDFSYMRVRHAVETAGASWGSATTIEDKVARPGTSVTLGARAGTYLIKAYDKTGLPSQNAASVVVSADELPTYGTTDTQTEHSAFSGTKTDCSVNGSSQLQITDPSSAPSEATYDFSANIDTGAVRRVRASGHVKLLRLNESAGLFDDTPGLFDAATGLFDDMGSDGSFADVNVTLWVSTTPDDPSGSPTWSDWRRLTAADLYGRAFRFRAILSSTSDDITPAISELSAKVEY